MLLNQKNQHGGDIYQRDILYDFSANISPLGTPQKVKNAVIASAQKVLAYPDPYCTNLRLALSIHECVSKENIICGNGAADIIYGYATALHPQKALIIAPTFCEYENSLHSINCKVSYYITKEENNFALILDEEFLLNLKQNNYDVLYICNPNNPTGHGYEKDFIEKLLTLFHGRIFIDECFCDLTDEPKRYSVSDNISNNNRIFILKAFTKSYGMAGIRLGYGLTSDTDFLDKMCSITQTWNVSTVAQECGIAALTCDDFIEENRKIIKIEKEYLTKEFTKLKLKVFTSQANFILIKSPINLSELLLKHKIAIRSCENFIGLSNDFYRCAILSHDKNTALINALINAPKGQ